MQYIHGDVLLLLRILLSDRHLCQKIVPDFITAIRLIHECVDTETYTEGYELAAALSSTKIFAHGDWDSYDGNALGVKDLYEHELIVGSFDNLVAESL